MPTIFTEGGQALKLACFGGVTLMSHLPEIYSSHENIDVTSAPSTIQSPWSMWLRIIPKNTPQLCGLTYGITNADYTSAFKSKIKSTSIKLLSQNSKFIQLFATIGTTWKLVMIAFTLASRRPCVANIALSSVRSAWSLHWFIRWSLITSTMHKGTHPKHQERQ